MTEAYDLKNSSTPKAYLLEFTLEGLPKRTNNNGSCWQGRYAEAKKWKAKVKSAVWKNEKTVETLKTAKITLTRHSSHEPDFDGLVSSFKHILDGLIEAGVIINDKVSNIGQPTYLWSRTAKGKGFITVRVESAPVYPKEVS